MKGETIKQKRAYVIFGASVLSLGATGIVQMFGLSALLLFILCAIGAYLISKQ